MYNALEGSNTYRLAVQFAFLPVIWRHNVRVYVWWNPNEGCMSLPPFIEPLDGWKQGRMIKW